MVDSFHHAVDKSRADELFGDIGQSISAFVEKRTPASKSFVGRIVEKFKDGVITGALGASTVMGTVGSAMTAETSDHTSYVGGLVVGAALLGLSMYQNEEHKNSFSKSRGFSRDLQTSLPHEFQLIIENAGGMSMPSIQELEEGYSMLSPEDKQQVNEILKIEASKIELSNEVIKNNSEVTIASKSVLKMKN